MKSIHFISGLPRSGSTLLAAILKQNPSIRAGISSPVMSVMGSLVRQMSTGETSGFFTDERRTAILRGVMEGYYASADHVVDTSRGWTGNLPLVAELYPSAKVICCVRNLGWIINSFDKAAARNPVRAASVFGYRADQTLYERTQNLLDETKGIIGKPYGALKQAWFSDHASRLIFVDYDRLTEDPAGVVDALYAACGWPAFRHDFEDVEHSEAAFDEKIGMPGLHDVHGSVRKLTPRLSIPPDLFARYSDSAFWLNPAWNLRGVRVLAPLPQPIEKIA